MSEYLLTFHEDSSANATLFKDGNILFAAAEERFSRTKHQGGFPARCLRYITDSLGIPLDRIDIIICGNKYHPLPRIAWDNFPSFEHPFLGVSQKISLFYQHLIFRSPLIASCVERFNRRQLRRKFSKDVLLSDHHFAHAYSAYMTSGFEDALIITGDNYGDGISAAVFDGTENQCRRLYCSSALNSPGQFYGELAQLIGFHPLMAGKMTGLAARGDSSKAYGIVKDLFSLTKTKKDFCLPFFLFKSSRRGLYRALRRFSPEDIAAAAQKRFEDIMIEYVAEAVRCTHKSRVALAGGIFGNVLLNQRIAGLQEVDEIFIHPGMNDHGISLGVGLQYLAEQQGRKPFRLSNIYFGPEYTAAEMESAIKRTGIPHTYEHGIEAKVAELLAQGHVVARFNGKLEYGPRALGNRSILYQTTDPSVNEWLNRRLHRSEFMPFAPVTLSEHADRCYMKLDKCRYTAQFMTISADCTDYMKKTSPGVVHIDGTARPQILYRHANPSFYTILERYYQKTGIPSLINTSFNMHGEPIVTSPEDALRSFQQGNLDYLAMGKYLLKHPSISEKQGM